MVGIFPLETTIIRLAGAMRDAISDISDGSTARACRAAERGTDSEHDPCEDQHGAGISRRSGQR